MNLSGNYRGIAMLAALVVGLPLLVWSYGIRRSVELRRTVREQAVQIEAAKKDTAMNAPASSVMPARTETGTLKNGAALHRLAGSMSGYNIAVERYTPYVTFSEAGSELYTGELLINGKFIELTRFLAEVERAHAGGNVVSVEYRVSESPQNRQRRLQLTLIMQQIATPDKSDGR